MSGEQPDDVVGHKTVYGADGQLRHAPLTRSEAEALRRRAEEQAARRQELMPDEAAALRMFCDAYQRLKEFGWREAMYCPKDGSTFHAIEAGSSGIHDCHYEGEWPSGSWWVHGHGDLWPSSPVLYRVPERGNNHG